MDIFSLFSNLQKKKWAAPLGKSEQGVKESSASWCPFKLKYKAWGKACSRVTDLAQFAMWMEVGQAALDSSACSVKGVYVGSGSCFAFQNISSFRMLIKAETDLVVCLFLKHQSTSAIPSEFYLYQSPLLTCFISSVTSENTVSFYLNGPPKWDTEHPKILSLSLSKEMPKSRSFSY